MAWNITSHVSKITSGEASKVNIDRSVLQSSTVAGRQIRLAILLPHTGEWSAEFVEKTWIPLKSRPLDWCEKQFYLCRVPSLPLARNILVAEALKNDCQFLFWVDSDMIIESCQDINDALKTLYNCLVETGESIVSGLYRAKQVHGFNYAMWKKAPPELNKRGYVHVSEWSGNWINVDTVGIGACLMRSKVFEQLKQPYFHWEEPDCESEDFNLLSKCRELGIKIWVFTDVKFSHIGNMVLECRPDEVECPKCKTKIPITKFRVPAV